MRIKGLMIVFFVLATVSSYSQMYEEKAELTHKLIQYFVWNKKNKNSDFLRVGVYGSYEMYRELANVLVGESVTGYNIDAVYISTKKDITLVDYDIVYISKNYCSPAQLKELIAMLEDTNSVIIGESKRAIANGADISFFVVEGELQAEYSFHKCVAKELKIGSRVDAVAVRVN